MASSRIHWRGALSAPPRGRGTSPSELHNPLCFWTVSLAAGKVFSRYPLLCKGHDGHHLTLGCLDSIGAVRGSTERVVLQIVDLAAAVVEAFLVL